MRNFKLSLSIMNLKLIGHAVFLILTFSVATACAEQKGNDVSLKASSVVTITEERASTLPPKESFRHFYAEFSLLVKNKNWKALADATHFPIIFRGELDSDPSFSLSRAGFLATLPGYVASETLVTLGNDVMPMRVADLIIYPVDKPTFSSDSAAEIHGLKFRIIDGKWRLSKVYAYLENFEIKRN